MRTIGLLDGMSWESTVLPRDAANCPLPVSGTTLLHVQAALDWACAGGEA